MCLLLLGVHHALMVDGCPSLPCPEGAAACWATCCQEAAGLPNRAGTGAGTAMEAAAHLHCSTSGAPKVSGLSLQMTRVADCASAETCRLEGRKACCGAGSTSKGRAHALVY